jgi:hypothetical protein
MASFVANNENRKKSLYYAMLCDSAHGLRGVVRQMPKVRLAECLKLFRSALVQRGRQIFSSDHHAH